MSQILVPIVVPAIAGGLCLLIPRRVKAVREILTLAGLFGVRAGCICVVSDRTPWPGPAAIDLDRNMGECIEVAGQAMRTLA